MGRLSSFLLDEARLLGFGLEGLLGPNPPYFHRPTDPLVYRLFPCFAVLAVMLPYVAFLYFVVGPGIKHEMRRMLARMADLPNSTDRDEELARPCKKYGAEVAGKNHGDIRHRIGDGKERLFDV
ncbi:hypothetical protein DL95DRAFT_477264 [Leptodontidium sp. 2 PMI_412]|nr:hypothetical protein BKA61DRAFT_654786 [Leptodontidium sp. MPI-SDFR-AT-0119]KAH9209492.1 hypothetical protein DL95DRAFT_477264 [Leptodontidium sp. 2 PMI_412]